MMAREGQTILAFGILAGMAYFFRNQLKALFSSAKAGQSTAGSGGNAPTKNPVGADGGGVRGIADAIGRISAGVMGATQWGIAQPTFGSSVTYKDIGRGSGGGTTIYYPPPTDSPENEFPGRD